MSSFTVDSDDKQHISDSLARLHSISTVNHVEFGVKGTGFMTWNAALVTKEFLKRKRLHKKHSPPLKILDVSSGNGFLTLAAACMGARVYSTECGDLALNLLKANIAHNSDKFPIVPIPIEYTWGESTTALENQMTYIEGSSTSISTSTSTSTVIKLSDLDVVIFSDLLYISFRDSIQDIFFNAILSLIPINNNKTEIIFCFERRKYEDEKLFLLRLEKYFIMNELNVIDEGFHEACKENNSGVIEDEEEIDMFYKIPPVRLILMKRKPLEVQEQEQEVDQELKLELK